jgi:DNA-binding winged helix-turn-helix (wHTH) protein
MPDPPIRLAYRFDAFVLDERSRQLLRGGQEVHLSPKAFDLLSRLIRARPQALSKSELHAHLWPGTFVTDASLGMLVTEIRSALGDPARGSRFVRTIHRFGYAFHGRVTEVAEPSSSAGPFEVTCWLVSRSQQFMLAPGANLVGRDPRAAVWLDSPGISRHHARLTIDGGHVVVEDLGSKNGTHLRGQLLTQPLEVADGDEIRFGSMRLTLRVLPALRSTATEV